MTPRVLRWATWAAIAVPVPYTVSRLLWAAGVPVGIERELLAELHVPGWGSLYVVLLAVLAELPGLWLHAAVRSRARRLPAWLPRAGGRAARPALVLLPLAVVLAVLWWRAVLHLPAILDGFRLPAGVEGVPPWALWAQVAIVWAWALSLSAAAGTLLWLASRPGGWDDASHGR